MVSSVVSSRRRNTSIWVTSTARTNSPSGAQFICLLSKVAVREDRVGLAAALEGGHDQAERERGERDRLADRRCSPKCDAPSVISASSADRDGQPGQPDGDHQAGG